MFRFTIFPALSTLYYIIREEQQISDLVVFHTLVSYGELNLSLQSHGFWKACQVILAAGKDRKLLMSRGSVFAVIQGGQSPVQDYFEYEKETFPFGLKN